MPSSHNNDRDRWGSPWSYEPRLAWSGILRVALEQLGGSASLRALYLKIERELLPRTQLSTQTKARIRQALHEDPMIRRVSPKVWRLGELPAQDKGKSR